MKKTLAIALALAFAATALAQETPGWIRKSSISPDGKTIAFAWQGDIFTVSSSGGQARQITTNPAYDSEPFWTEDGGAIVFSSYREGGKDIWVVPAQGGTPKRLTTFNGNETPLAVKGGNVYFQANIQQDSAFGGFPGTPQLYRTNLAGSRPELLSSIPMGALSVGASGLFLYEDYKGYEDPLRKHHTSSVTRDIWAWNPAGGTFIKLSRFSGEDRNPVFCTDSDNYWYLSEEDGTFNVWKASVSNPEARSRITSMETHPVRGLSASAEGTLLFSWNGDLYTFREGDAPAKVSISIAKDKNAREKIWRNIGSGATSLAVSPNGKEVALVAGGDVYVTSVEYRTTRRITDTPEQERGVCFSADGRTIFYASERDGEWAIWKTSLAEKKDNSFTYSYDFKEERVTPKGETCFQPATSPDGKWIAYLKNRADLVIRNLGSNAEHTLVNGINYSYSDGDQSFCWSPDSHYILCNWFGKGGWNNQDVALVDIDERKVTNLTQSGYSDGGFRWALGGKAVTWKSDKMGYRSHGSWGTEDDVFIMFLDSKTLTEFRRDKEEEELDRMMNPKEEKRKGKEAAKEEKKDSAKVEKSKKTELFLDGREDRIVRLTSNSGHIGDQYLSPDGKKLYYCVQLEKTMDLCSKDLKTGDVRVISRNVRGRFQPDKEGRNIYMLGSNGMVKIDLGSGKSTPISFSSEYEYKPAAERAYIFEHAWKQVEEKFYDPGIHGVDWKGLHDNYAQFLPQIDNNFDFQDLLSELLGELNASHTGARYRYNSGLNTGYLGVLYDSAHKGKGLKIKEVLPGGTLALADSEIKAGDIVLAIDGKEIGEDACWYDVLARTAGKRIQVKVKKGGKTEYLFVKPASSDNDPLYRRWVRQREEMVAKISGGKVGYVHVKSMDSNSFREVFSNALGKYRNCDALIVDTRHNGGGWLHDDLVTFLGGKAYVEFRPRGQYIGTEPYTKWTKPNCVLIGEDNYSDACGFPYAYKALGLGKLIGAPVPGTMTAVWWETQVDPSLVFGIPEVTTWALAEDRPLENMQIEPDILVYNNPASELEGRDLQLEAAVAEMLKETEK